MAHWTRGLAALALAGGLVAGGIALARGPDMNLPIFGPTAGYGGYFFDDRPVRYEEPERRAPRKRANVSAFGYGKAICVKLCDGSFFPTASVSGGDAACASQCPDAPTALYTMPTDRIEDAVSSAGVSYSKLPVAKRYQTTFDNTCTCHRDVVASRAKDLLNDTTLRKGDVVMTAEGFRVYQGDGYGPSDDKDFVTLAKARVSKEQRATLTAMERASAGPRAPSGPELIAARPKGRVTVDSGVASAAH